MYKVSKFTLIYPYEDQYLVYNTLTQAFVLINADLYTAITNLDTPEFHTISHDITAQLDVLASQGVLVNPAEDEDKKANVWLWQKRSQPQKIIATILTTYACNFACSYCFETGIENHSHLEVMTAIKIAQWLTEYSRKRKCPNIEVVFYGGEPLLNVRAISAVNIILTTWAEETGGTYGFSMVTNGSLFDAKMLDQLKPFGLKGVKITLDGYRDMHDLQRPFQNGGGTFDTIFNNILETVDHTKIILSANLTDKNVQSVHRLIDFLVEHNLQQKLFRFECSPIVTPLDGACQPESPLICSDTTTYLLDEMVTIRERLYELGFQSKFSMIGNRCSLVSNGSELTFDPNGDIYSCNLLVGRKEYRVGHIRNHHFDPFHKEMMAFTPWQHEKCHTCPFLPACNGGCRYKAFTDKGSFNAVNCMQDFFYKSFPKWVKMEYEKMVQQSQQTDTSFVAH